MRTEKDALLYGPNGESIDPASYAKKDVSSLDMQPYVDSTKFNIGSLVEIRFRDINDTPRRPGSSMSLGYVIEDGDYESSIVLSMCLPKKRWKQKRKGKNIISDFRIIPQTKDECLLGSYLLENVMIGSIVELFERAKNPLESVKHAGYISRLSSGSIKISMDHPANRYGSSFKTEKFDTYSIEQFRVLGHRRLW